MVDKTYLGNTAEGLPEEIRGFINHATKQPFVAQMTLSHVTRPGESGISELVIKIQSNAHYTSYNALIESMNK